MSGSGLELKRVNPWTREKIDEMIERRKSGESCSQIARALGGGITRNGVIGKIHRLGLRDIGPEVSTKPRAKISAVRHGSGGQRCARSLPTSGTVVVMRPKPQEPDAIGPVGEFPARGCCKWTNDDPRARDAAGQLTFRMCGHEAPNGPWCEFHFDRARNGQATRAAYEKSLEAAHNTEIRRAFG